MIFFRAFKPRYWLGLVGLFLTFFGQSQIPQNDLFSDSLFSKTAFKTFVERQLNRHNAPHKETVLKHLSPTKTPKRSKLPKLNGALSIEFFWNDGDTLLYGNAANQSFTYLSSDFSTAVFGLPMRVGGNLVFENQNWRRDLSTYTLRMDYQALLAQKKQALQQEALQEKLKTLSSEDRAVWKNRLTWETLYPIVYDPAFKATEQRLTQELDSLKNKGQELRGAAMEKWTAQKAALEEELGNYKQAQETVSQLLDYYQKYGDAFQKADSLRGVVANWEQEGLEKIDKFKSTKAGLKGIATQGLERLLGSIQDVEIGSFSLNSSDLTVRGLLVNGVRVQTQTGRIFNELAFGKQNTATRDYMVGFQAINGAKDLNRNLFYLRSGVGAKDSSFLHVSLTRILDNYKTPLATAQRPHTNDLIGVSIQEKLGKQAVLAAEMAYSLFQNNAIGEWTTAPEVVGEKQNNLNFAAFQVRLKADEDSKWQWSVGYDYIGSKFTTLGNPYLLNNRQILRGAFGKQFWKNKLSLKLKFDKNISLPNTLEWQPTVDQTGVSAEVGLRYGRSNRFVAKLAPRYFLLSAMGGTEGVGRSDVYSIQNTLQGKIKDMKWFSFLNMTNMNLLMPMRDSGQLSGFNYIFTQNMLTINRKWAISAVGNLGLEGGLSSMVLREAMAQLSSQWTFKKGSLGIGVQSFRTVGQDFQLGGQLTGSFQTAKMGAWGGQFSYRESLLARQPKTPVITAQTFYRFSF